MFSHISQKDVNTDNIKNDEQRKELPDSWWHRVYAAVMVTTVLVISALWAFTHYFSS